MNPRALLVAATAGLAFGPACRRAPAPNPPAQGQQTTAQAPQAATVVVYKSPT